MTLPLNWVLVDTRHEMDANASPSCADLLTGGPSHGRVDSQWAWWYPWDIPFHPACPGLCLWPLGTKLMSWCGLKAQPPTCCTTACPELSAASRHDLRGLPRSLCRLARISHQKSKTWPILQLPAPFSAPALGLPSSPMSPQYTWTWILTRTHMTRKTPAVTPNFFLAVLCGMWDLSSLTGNEPSPPALGEWSLNHWMPPGKPLYTCRLHPTQFGWALSRSAVSPVEGRRQEDELSSSTETCILPCIK